MRPNLYDRRNICIQPLCFVAGSTAMDTLTTADHAVKIVPRVVPPRQLTLVALGVLHARCAREHGTVGPRSLS